MTSNSKWYGSMKCDLCGDDLSKRDTLFDARVKGGTAWGTLCLLCFVDHGVGLGLGIGQAYEKKGDELYKIKG